MAAASWRRLRSAIPASRAWRTAAVSRRSRACDVRMPQCTIRYMFHLLQGRGRMARLHVEAQGVVRAAAEVVWELVADADSYHDWGPWSSGGDSELRYRAALGPAGDSA